MLVKETLLFCFTAVISNRTCTQGGDVAAEESLIEVLVFVGSSHERNHTVAGLLVHCCQLGVGRLVILQAFIPVVFTSSCQDGTHFPRIE